ncbi:iron ABC transporter permease [Paenibacillus sp. FSL R5-0527]|uniref:FecCD family ABC transporter permease n=2 Tax=Paenibacillus sp. FSL R5-0527 TaxID=2975321 RepID=UPI00097B50AB|nr:ferrichrome ABC transporter permease [Paenibacillus macerans]
MKIPGNVMRISFWYLAAVLILLVTMFLAISYGAKEMTLGTVYSAIFHYDPAVTTHQIIHDLRLPRVFGAALVGSALAVAGALMQGITRNPLADTGILGINAGAACVVALSFAFWPGISYSGLMLLSFAGAAAACLIITALASLSAGGMTSLHLTVAGTVMASILSSVSSGIAIYFDLNQDLAFWYAGGVGGITWEHLRVLTPVILLTLLGSVALGKPLSFLALGEESASSLGVKTGRIRLLGMAAVVILAGSAVSVAGSISFVGLAVPHIVRKLVGVNYRNIIGLSALLGPVLLLWADFGARMINPPRELAIGILVALVGVPFFLYLARQERREL